MNDLLATTYTDDAGEQCGALDYLMQDGDLAVPGGRYGSDTEECAPIAVMLFVVTCGGGAEDSVDALDECMSEVVNGGDEVCWTILDGRHALRGMTFEGEPLDPYAFFDADEIDYARELYSAAYCGEPASF